MVFINNVAVCLLIERENRIRERRKDQYKRKLQETRIRRLLRDQSDTFRLSDDSFINLYRLPKHLIIKLIKDPADQCTVSRIIRKITNYVFNMAESFISFPTTTERRQKTEQK